MDVTHEETRSAHQAVRTAHTATETIDNFFDEENKVSRGVRACMCVLACECVCVCCNNLFFLKKLNQTYTHRTIITHYTHAATRTHALNLFSCEVVVIANLYMSKTPAVRGVSVVG